MTVREKLLALHRDVAAAELARTVYLVELRNAGYSLRQLAGVLGVAPSTVMRWGPLENDEGAPDLDEEAE